MLQQFDPLTGAQPADAVRKADIDAYAHDGVVALRGVISSLWIDRLRESIDAALAGPGEKSETYEQGKFVGDLDLWRRIEGFRTFVLNSPAGEISASLMKSETATFFYDQMLVKEPGSPHCRTSKTTAADMTS